MKKLLFTFLLLLFSKIAISAPLISDKELYDLRGKCNASVSEEFKKEWGNGFVESSDSSMIANYNSHYNTKLKKCFYLLNVSNIAKNGNDIELKNIMDVIEHKVYGIFNSDKLHGVNSCEVDKAKCKSLDEWNLLISPFMKD